MRSAAPAPGVLCLGAGPTQLPLIRGAASLGLEVVAVDRRPDAEALPLAHRALRASTHDPEAVLAALARLDPAPDLRAVLCRSSGPPVRTAAVVARALGLPGVPPSAAEAAIHKGRFRTLCAGLGLPGPGFALVSAPEALPAAVRLPAVVRPALPLVGKAAVRRARDGRELAAAVAEAASASQDGRAVVEDFVEGVDVVLLALVRQGRLEPLAWLDELVRFGPAGRARGLGFAWPSALSPELRSGMRATAARIAAALGIHTSAFHLSARVTPEGRIVPVELHLDLGGDLLLDELLPAAGHGDLLRRIVARLAGLGPPVAVPERGAAAILFAPGAGLPRERARRVLRAADRPGLAARLPSTRDAAEAVA